MMSLSILRGVTLAMLTAGCLMSQQRTASAGELNQSAGLGSQNICSFSATKDAKGAMAFYRDTLAFV